MISLKSDADIQMYFNKSSHEFIIEQMKKDCPVFANQIGAGDYEWIGRVMLHEGSKHEGSKIQYGFLLRYQFRKINIGFDMGIREIIVAESMDELLDLINDIKKDDSVFNKEMRK
jgi:hypothetical protein